MQGTLNTDKRFAEIVKNPNKPDIDAFIMDAIKQMQNTPDSYDAKTAPMYFFAYLLYSEYGVDSDNKVVNDYLLHSYKLILEMSKQKASFGVKPEQDFKINGALIPKIQQDVIKQIKSGFDLTSFLQFNDVRAQTNDRYSVNPALNGSMKDYYNSGSIEASDLLNAKSVTSMATYVSSIIGIDLLELNGPVSITRDEQNMIIKWLADMGSGSTASELRQQISVSNYILGHIFMLLSKEIRNIKTFYFKNNSETQYLELQRLENAVEAKDHAIERLKVELANADERSERQRNEITRLTEEVFSGNKEAVKPYVSEIAELNVRIRELEKALGVERAKTSELNALREFAFAVQSEYVPPETSVTFAELLRGRKIIIVGGHVNWRNRLKTNHPTVELLDGHSVSLDVSIFDKADFTLLNTANMSHKLYYKVIGYLREKNLEFAYIGRSRNQDLLEAEIISILQEKMLM